MPFQCTEKHYLPIVAHTTNTLRGVGGDAASDVLGTVHSARTVHAQLLCAWSNEIDSKAVTAMGDKDPVNNDDDPPVAKEQPRAPRLPRMATVRLDAGVVDRFKAAGPGWRLRIEDALREWLANRDA